MKKGFTLLEVIFAVGILASALTVVVSFWTSNYTRLRKAQLYHNVSTLMEKKMTELEVLFYDKPIESLPKELKGQFEGFPQYSWSFKSKEFQMPDLSPLLVSKEQGANELLLLMIKKTGENISKAVKEGTLTIHVKVKGKTVNYSVTRLFVDFNKQLTLLGSN